jgi:chloramphenicol 3-O-phosphotransferase
MVDSVFINGTVGAGKSTLAEAMSALETSSGHPHALIDLDSLRRFWPAPPGDRFNHGLELENLRHVAANYRRAGAQHFVLAGVMEEAAQVPRYEEALQSDRVLVCRVVATAEVVAARLARRHADDSHALDWHLRRALELTAILDAAALDDLVLDSTSTLPAELATQLRVAAGW